MQCTTRPVNVHPQSSISTVGRLSWSSPHWLRHYWRHVLMTSSSQPQTGVRLHEISIRFNLISIVLFIVEWDTTLYSVNLFRSFSLKIVRLWWCERLYQQVKSTAVYNLLQWDWVTVVQSKMNIGSGDCKGCFWIIISEFHKMKFARFRLSM